MLNKLLKIKNHNIEAHKKNEKQNTFNYNFRPKNQIE